MTILTIAGVLLRENIGGTPSPASQAPALHGRDVRGENFKEGEEDSDVWSNVEI